MIYLFIGNDLQPEQISQALKIWKPMKSQVQFLLGPNGDDVLRASAGLEEFQYLFSLEDDLFQRLIDLRFEIEQDSLIVTDLTIPLSRIFRFREIITESPERTDFYRLLDIDRLDGAIFMTKLGYNRLWAVSPGHPVRESHFRWMNLDPDSCLNLPQDKAKNLPEIE